MEARTAEEGITTLIPYDDEGREANPAAGDVNEQLAVRGSESRVPLGQGQHHPALIELEELRHS
jgi:hypothetical protein